MLEEKRYVKVIRDNSVGLELVWVKGSNGKNILGWNGDIFMLITFFLISQKLCACYMERNIHHFV